MRIEFQKQNYQYDDMIRKSIEICEEEGSYLQIDENFCVYAFFDGCEHWVGYAKPHDLSWFDSQFKGANVS